MKHYHLIAIMLAIPLIVLLIVEIIIFIPLKNDNYFVSSLIRARLGETTCIIAGDSHPASAFRSELTGQCDNLATGGVSTWMVVDLIKSVSKNNRLDTAIISIGPHYFSSYRVENKSTAFKNIAEWFTPLPNFLSQNEVLAGFLIKWSKEKLNIQKQKEPNSLSISPQRIDQHTPIENWIDSEISHQYKKMITDLVNNGTRVCVVRTPIIDEYKNKLKMRYNQDEWRQYLKDIKNIGAYYITYSEVSSSYPLTLFSNPEHLNKDGAKIFAPKLLNMCLNQK